MQDDFSKKKLVGPSEGLWWAGLKISESYFVLQTFMPFQAICNIFHFYDFPTNPKIGGVPKGGGGGHIGSWTVLK